MQTNSLKGNSISTVAALKELSTDMAKFGLAGIFRGQGIGIAKATVSPTESDLIGPTLGPTRTYSDSLGLTSTHSDLLQT